MRARPFDGDDDARVVADLVAAVAARNPRCGYWHVGDVWWGLYQHSPTVFDPRENIRLWLGADTGVAIGFAWYYPRGNGVSTVVYPGHVARDALDTLDAEMISWAEERRRTLPPGGDGARTLTATAFDHDKRRIALLEGRGYRRDGTPLYHFQRALSAPILTDAPRNGITVRQVGDEYEWAERVEAHRDVWRPSRVTPEAYRRLRAAPGYAPELDLVAVTPEGAFASYCICWLDRANRTGEFEPVGTRPAFRRQGLSRVVLAEGLRRLRDRGATDAIVYTPQTNENAVDLYKSVGFSIAGSEYDYVKRL